MKSTVYQTREEPSRILPIRRTKSSCSNWSLQSGSQLPSFFVFCLLFFSKSKIQCFWKFWSLIFKIKTVFLSLSSFPTSLNGCRILPLSAAKRNIDLQESMARWPLLQIERPSIWPPRHELKIERARVFWSLSEAGDLFLGRHVAGLVTRQKTAAFKIVLPCRWPDS